MAHRVRLLASHFLRRHNKLIRALPRRDTLAPFAKPDWNPTPQEP